MNTAQVLSDPAAHPIQPHHIDAMQHFWDAFDHHETEVSARYIVGLCQERGGWLPFTEEEIERFYQKSGHKNFIFNRLIEPGTAYSARLGRFLKGGGWI